MTPITDDAEYFRAIEETFIRLNSAPTLLTPGDFGKVHSWRLAGVPLELVISTMKQVFSNRRARGDLSRVNSLRYFYRAVDEAWAREESKEDR